MELEGKGWRLYRKVPFVVCCAVLCCAVLCCAVLCCAARFKLPAVCSTLYATCLASCAVCCYVTVTSAHSGDSLGGRERTFQVLDVAGCTRHAGPGKQQCGRRLLLVYCTYRSGPPSLIAAPDPAIAVRGLCLGALSPPPAPLLPREKWLFCSKPNSIVQAVVFSLVLPPQAVRETAYLFMISPISHMLACTAATSVKHPSIGLRTTNAVMLACTWKAALSVHQSLNNHCPSTWQAPCLKPCFSLHGTLLQVDRHHASS